MTILFTAALIVGAFLTFAFILRKIRNSEIKIADSVFWFLFGGSLVLLAVFPRIAFFCADVFAIESPSNFVFLYVIATLVIREFYSTVELSQLRSKVTALVQIEALREIEAHERASESLPEEQRTGKD